MNKKLMFVVNVDWFFMSHRLPIALEALRQGYEVHIATELTDHRETMERLGLVVHHISIDRSSANIFAMLRTFSQIVALFREVRPELVHLVTIKPVLLGGVAVRIAGIRGVVVAITGLGYVFLDRGWLSGLRRKIVGSLYRVALGHRNLKVIFQNPDDRDCLIRMARLPQDKIEMIHGSGVDLAEFHPTPLPGIPVVLMAARLLADKGVCEFADAARMLRDKGRSVRCCLVGSPDPANPSSLTEAELAVWEAEGIIERWGHRDDMSHVLEAAYIVVLPSYREGLPKVLLEAEAAGRAVVTTDVPGCRDAIEVDATGMLVPAHDARALAVAIEALLDDPQRCAAMGVAGRALAEREFDIRQVVERHLQIYRELLERSAPE
jgi:glycosyltransferase involved in cell wall biosynthesis